MVHPHACGELRGNLFLPFFLTGSSPRMWGTPSRITGEGSGTWFIPTHVGNSNAFCLTVADWFPVHPHACGELVRELFELWNDYGSSPRMWGTHLDWKKWYFHTRFIPTHVGNSNHLPTLTIRKMVHPHACGELFNTKFGPFKPNGSSPRMWGTHKRGETGRHSEWFIPTHVGNSVT